MINLKINNEVLEDIELIIFDKDGTLFDLYTYCSKMVFQRTDAICKVLNNNDKEFRDWLVKIMGVDLENKKIFPEGPIGVYSKYYAQDLLYEKLNAQDYKIDQEELKNAFGEADANINEIEYLKGALVPVKGMIEFIKNMDNQCKCAIFSNDMTERLNDTLKIFQIENYFHYVLGGDLIEKHKPDPWGALKIMNELKILPENTTLIGDSNLDVEAGKRAKCKYIISLKSDISDLKFCKENAGYLIDDFTKIEIL